MRQTDETLTDSVSAFATGALHTQFGLRATLGPLAGEHDLNFKADAPDGARYLFKIHGADVSRDRIDLQAAVLRFLEQRAPELPLPRLFLGRSGEALPQVRDPQGRERRLRLTTWLAGETWAEASVHGPQSATSLGLLLAELDRVLAEFHHPAAEQAYGWDLARAGERIADAALIGDPERRAVAEEILQRFVDVVAPALRDRPRQVIHGDANDRNVLLDAGGLVSGLIDFGDMVESWRVNELAVAAAYLAVGAASGDPVAAMVPLLQAYCAENPIAEVEADHLLDLIFTRYAVSMAMAARQIRAQPDNAYLLISQEDVWRGIQALRGLDRALTVARLRDACGFEPVGARRAIERWILENNRAFGPVLPLPMNRTDVTVLPLGADRDATRGLSYAQRLEQVLPGTAGLPIGRYAEDRSHYGGGERTLHHAIDLYAPAGTPVLAPLPGRVAMLGNDTAPEGFGGILVLEHESGTPHAFWTVYGHLAPAGLAGLKPGKPVAKGDELGRLGIPSENGGWPPHLHFQILTILCFARAEDIIGLSAPAQWSLWESICPNPNGILGLAVDAAAAVPRAPRELMRLRRRWISGALSLSYDAPLKIVGGEGATLIAEDGRRYLDMVNNVCHVGHQHPRVVAAIQGQVARLNTNTRYLHDNLVEYAHRLTLMLPPELSTVFLVNSGSEANDLALRLARAYTGGTDVMVLDHAYHGNLSALIDISPYKFDGPGGGGRPRHVWVTEMPDLYRGRIRYDEAAAGLGAGPRYAERVTTLLRDMSGLNRRLAALFAEPLLGCGGQLVLPEGYLAAAFEEVRAAGGVCIADEVQVGFGRVGSHFWAFETQNVVPDIVTMGKPIGNGHPMGAVACRPEIAAALANGMEYFNTFGGNPVSAAAGLAVLDVIRDERLMHNAAAMGDRLMDGARDLARRHKLIGDVRGLGLFIGIELVRDREAQEPADTELRTIIEALKGEGLLLSSEGPHHNVLKIKPPIVISAAECDRFLVAFDRALARLG